jgi:hypothetical protein
MSTIAIPNLEETTFSIVYSQLFNEMCSAFANPHTRDNNFSAVRNFRSTTFSRNLATQLHIHTSTINCEKVVVLRLASSKLDFQTSATLSRIQIWIHWDQELFVELGSDPKIILEADVDTK